MTKRDDVYESYWIVPHWWRFTVITSRFVFITVMENVANPHSDEIVNAALSSVLL